MRRLYRGLDLATSLAATRSKCLPPSVAIDRWRTWAQKRFHHALLTVERIRRLSKPSSPRVAIQINQVEAPEVTCAQVEGQVRERVAFPKFLKR
jgi:hypothetical protein